MSGHYQIYADCSTRVMHLNVEAEEDINWTELCWKTWTIDKLRTRCVADDFGYVMPGQRQKRVSERHWWFPSTTWRQVMRNTLNSSGDSTLTMVPLCRGLSGTKITLGRRWKSRGQVGKLWTLQEVLYTTSNYLMTHPWVIYYDSKDDTAHATNSPLIVMSHKDSSLMTNW